MNDKTQGSPGMAANKPMLLGGALALVLVAMLVWFWGGDRTQPKSQPVSKLTEPKWVEPKAAQPEPGTALATSAESTETELETSSPEPSFEEQALAEEKKEIEPLPSLNDSDTAVLAALDELPYDLRFVQWLVPDEVIRKFVRAVENIRQGKLVHKYRPVRIPLQAFNPEKVGGQYRMSARSFKRYNPYVDALTHLDMTDLVVVYRRYYPLLQQAYDELGVGRGSFHASLLGAIDHLLAAPVIEAELLLVRPSVMYKYADLAIEGLPATHKLMLRMGPDNMRRVQESLQRLRQALAE